MNKNILKVIAILCISSILLVGCGNKMYNKAIEQGKLAVANKEYNKAKASFELALEEKDDEDARNMLIEVENMLAGLQEKESGNIDEAIDLFSKITKGNSILSSIVDEAKELEVELKKTKDEMIAYEDKIIEAKNMLQEKQYDESKDMLNLLIEETSENKSFDKQNKKARETLEEVDLAVKEAEKQKYEEEEAEKRRITEEKKKKELEKEEIVKYYIPSSGIYLTKDGFLDYYYKVGPFDYTESDGQVYMYNPGGAKADSYYWD